MNKRQKKKLFIRCNIWHYAEFKNMVHHLPKNIRKFMRMYANANYKLIHTKLPKNIYKENLETLVESAAPEPSKCLIPFKPYLYDKYDISNGFVKYNRGSTPVQHINQVSPPTTHSSIMDMYMDCYNNHDLEKFDKAIENLSKQLSSPKTFGKDDYFWLLDVIDNATCCNDPIEEVIDYIDRLLTDCGYDAIQVYQHILDKDEFIITYPSENAEICLKAMGVSVAKTIYDFTKEFKDIARAAMSFHPELVDKEVDYNVSDRLC